MSSKLAAFVTPVISGSVHLIVKKYYMFMALYCILVFPYHINKIHTDANFFIFITYAHKILVKF